MTRFRARIVVWSALHKPVRIFELSHVSVFESPSVWHSTNTNLDRVQIFCYWVQIAKLDLNCCSTQPNTCKEGDWNIRRDIESQPTTCTVTHACTYTRTHTYTLIHAHMHTLTCTHTSTLTHTYSYVHSYVYIYSYIYIYILIHTYT